MIKVIATQKLGRWNRAIWNQVSLSLKAYFDKKAEYINSILNH